MPNLGSTPVPRATMAASMANVNMNQLIPTAKPSLSSMGVKQGGGMRPTAPNRLPSGFVNRAGQHRLMAKRSQPYVTLVAGLEEQEASINYPLQTRNLLNDLQKDWRIGTFLFGYNTNDQYLIRNQRQRHQGVTAISLSQLNKMAAQRAAIRKEFHREQIQEALEEASLMNSRKRMKQTMHIGAKGHEDRGQAARDAQRYNFQYRGFKKQTKAQRTRERTPANFAPDTVREFMQLFSPLGYILEEQGGMNEKDRMFSMQVGGKMTVPNIFGNQIDVGDQVGFIVTQSRVDVSRLSPESTRVAEVTVNPAAGIFFNMSFTVKNANRGGSSSSSNQASVQSSLLNSSASRYIKHMLANQRQITMQKRQNIHMPVTTLTNNANATSSPKSVWRRQVYSSNPRRDDTFIQIIPYVGKPHHNSGPLGEPTAFDMDSWTGEVLYKATCIQQAPQDIVPEYNEKNVQETNESFPSAEHMEMHKTSKRFQRTVGKLVDPNGRYEEGHYIRLGTISHCGSHVSHDRVQAALISQEAYNKNLNTRNSVCDILLEVF